MNKHPFLIIAFAGVLLCALSRIPTAQACQICVPYPEETLADRLLENDEIIFAREVADSPYFFYQVEVLKGPGVSRSLKMFCDSATRRKLRAIPDSVVVLARKKDERWYLIAHADTGFQPFIRTIVSRGEGWSGLSDNRDRLRFFSRFLHSDDERIHRQAYIEVGRAPYAMIKDLAAEISREQIYDLLRNYRLIEWQNLYILMLGQSRETDDLDFIRDKVQSAARFGSTQNLAAWVTAFIESHPDSGVEDIERLYFMSKTRSDDEIVQVLTSMSILGSQTREAPLDQRIFKLRLKIVRSYATLLENYPEMAGYVAKDLAAWQIRAHTDIIASIRERRELANPSSIYAVDYYLSAAPGFREARIGK